MQNFYRSRILSLETILTFWRWLPYNLSSQLHPTLEKYLFNLAWPTFFLEDNCWGASGCDIPGRKQEGKINHGVKNKKNKLKKKKTIHSRHICIFNLLKIPVNAGKSCTSPSYRFYKEEREVLLLPSPEQSWHSPQRGVSLPLISLESPKPQPPLPPQTQMHKHTHTEAVLPTLRGAIERFYESHHCFNSFALTTARSLRMRVQMRPQIWGSHRLLHFRQQQSRA